MRSLNSLLRLAAVGAVCLALQGCVLEDSQLQAAQDGGDSSNYGDSSHQGPDFSQLSDEAYAIHEEVKAVMDAAKALADACLPDKPPPPPQGGQGGGGQSGPGGGGNFRPMQQGNSMGGGSRPEPPSIEDIEAKLLSDDCRYALEGNEY